MVRAEVLASSMLMLALFAGCVGAEDLPTEEEAAAIAEELTGEELTDDQREAIGEALEAGAAVEAPQWEVGDWFGYHVFLGEDDEEGFHYNAIVVEDLGSSWVVATDDADMAMFHAIFDFPILGSFSKDDLSTTSEGYPWSWYRFPMEDGATWQASYTGTDFSTGELEEVQVVYTASFAPGIETRDGRVPGFHIEGRTLEGNLTAEYDYVPSMGWFAHAYLYDPDSGGDSWWLHLMTMGSGDGWAGTYYIDEAREVLVSQQDVSADPSAPNASPATPESFTITEEDDTVLGFAWAYAFGGAQDVSLVDPNGERYNVQAVGQPFAFNFDFIQLDAIVGDWHASHAGAGVAAGSGMYIWAIDESAFQLAPTA